MKFLKKLILTFISIILAVTLLLWLLTEIVKPELVKNYINSQLNILTSQPGHVNGRITWQLFPEPGIRITNIEVGDSDEHAPYQLKIDNLLFNLKITPLLRGHLVFSEIKVDGFTINSNAEKTLNLKKSNPDNTASHPALKSRFAVKRILLSRGQINYSNQNQTIRLTGLQIGTELSNTGISSLPVQLKADIQILENQKTAAQSHMEFKGSTVLPPYFLNNPLANLHTTALNGQLIMQNIRINHFKINRMAGNAGFHKGIFQLSPLTVSLYQGESVGDLRYENSSGKLLLNQTATGINSSDIMNALFQKKILKGKMDFSLHTETDMRTDNWLRDTAGTGVLSIKDGRLESVNLNHAVNSSSDKINTLLNRKTETKHQVKSEPLDDTAFFEGNTPFKLLSIRYQLQNTLLTSDSLLLQTDTLHLKGSGSLNLENGVLSSQLSATVLNTNKTDLLQKVLGGNFPILIGGTIMKPLTAPDLKKINPALTRLWVKETLVRPIHKIKKHLHGILSPQS